MPEAMMIDLTEIKRKKVEKEVLDAENKKTRD